MTKSYRHEISIYLALMLRLYSPKEKLRTQSRKLISRRCNRKIFLYNFTWYNWIVTLIKLRKWRCWTRLLYNQSSKILRAHHICVRICNERTVLTHFYDYYTGVCRKLQEKYRVSEKRTQSLNIRHLKKWAIDLLKNDRRQKSEKQIEQQRKRAAEQRRRLKQRKQALEKEVGGRKKQRVDP